MKHMRLDAETSTRNSIEYDASACFFALKTYVTTYEMLPHGAPRVEHHQRIVEILVGESGCDAMRGAKQANFTGLPGWRFCTHVL